MHRFKKDRRRSRSRGFFLSMEPFAYTLRLHFYEMKSVQLIVSLEKLDGSVSLGLLLNNVGAVREPPLPDKV